MSKNIVADSGFWFALLNERDDHHSDALEIERHIEQLNLLVPWPTLYETVNTRFVKRQECRDTLKRYLDKTSTVKIDDSIYKENAIEEVISPNARRGYSAVDYIIRNILEDPDVKTDALITFNKADFIDVCYSKGVEIIPR